MANKKTIQTPVHETLVRDFVQRLVGSYGYDYSLIATDYKLRDGITSDVAIWSNASDKEKKHSPSVCVVVVCKSEHVRVDASAYFDQFKYVQLNTHHFYVANNMKETKVYYHTNNTPDKLLQIADFPKVSDLQSEGALEAFIAKMRNNNKEALLAAFTRCHNIIRNNDKLSPEAAFDEISKIIFVKMMYERSNPKEELVYSRARFEKDEKNSCCNSYIDELFESVKNRYPDLFDSYDHIRISRNSFVSILSELEVVDFYDTTEDVKGVAFEAFLGKTFRGELGQFFTPRSVVNFMVEALGVREGEKVCDPCCGSGGFLISAFDRMQTQIEHDIDAQIRQLQSNTKLSDTEKKCQIDSLYSELDRTNKGSRMYRLCQDYLYGVDANPRMARTSKMNMIMHGDGNVGVYQHDGLTNCYNVRDGEFDVVLINPPYGVHIDRKQTDDEGIAIDKLYELKVSYAEDLFIERTLKLLKPGGRAGLVLPEGIMTNRNKQRVRDLVEKYARIINITSIPSDVFLASGANVKPNLLFIEKRNAPETNIDADDSITISVVTDGVINSIGIPTNNLQLKELAPVIQVWQSKRVLMDCPYIRQILREDMEAWKVAACFDTASIQYNSKYPTARLSEMLRQSREKAILEDDKNYTRVTVKLYNRGLTERDVVKGKNIKTRNQTIVHTGQFVISKIDGKSGAFGFVPACLEGAIVTPDFLVFDVDENCVIPEYLNLILYSPSILRQYAAESSGSTGRKRLQQNVFLKTIIPLPTLSEQRGLVGSIVELREEKERLEQQIEQKESLFRETIFK